MGWEQALAAFVLLAIAIGALGAVCAREDRRLLHQERQAEIYASVRRAAYQPQYPMLHTLNATEVERKALSAGISGQLSVVSDPPVPPLPGLVTLDQLLRTGWRPDPDHILLGLGPGGVRYEVPADDKLCHVLTVGRTGYGKSSFNRLLLPQLIACGFEVYLLDLDYAPVDPRNGEEWWPIAERTTPGDALYAVADIRAAIKEARAEVDRRHAIRRTVRGAAADLWPRRFYAIEEAPELVSQYPEFMDDAAHVLRRGRRVDVYLLLISQSGLIKVIGGNSDDRAMFGTIAYVGGVPTSARALLQETVPEPEGKGLARLRCYGVRTSAEARLPYGDNAGIRLLLETEKPGTKRNETERNGKTGPVLEGRFSPIPSPPIPVSPVSPTPEMALDPAKRTAVRAALQTDETYTDMVKRIWQVKPGGGPGWVAAGQEMRAIIADLTRGAD